MKSLPQLILLKDQERRLLAGNLWIYNNEIDNQRSPLSGFEKGTLVQLESSRGKGLGIAYINPNTLLCARLLTRNSQQNIDEKFFKERLLKANARRELCYDEPYYRMVFSESDELPGLIIDRFNDLFVVQINTAGMENLRSMILSALIENFSPRGVIFKNDSSYRDVEQLPKVVEVAFGEVPEEFLVKENGCEFFMNPQTGQKTGWFYDHRENRRQILRYVKNKRVLDVFSYVGAFSIPMAKSGAREVIAVDSSANALQRLVENAEHNQVQDKVMICEGDAFEILKQLKNAGEKFDVIVLDPPAFIKRKKEYKAGYQAYKQLNQLALSLLATNGVMLTASCSMHLSGADLQNCIRQAAVSLNRSVAILEHCHQGPDHPIHPAITETNYLKGFVVS